MGVALIAVMAFGAMAGGAAAHVSEEHGSLTFHDSEDGEPKTSADLTSQPLELHCEFWVQGHNVSHEEGTIEARHGPGPSVEVIVVGTFNGTTNESGGYDFEAGPFTLNETDEYSILAVMGEEQEERGTRTHMTPSHRVDYQACPDEGQAQDEPQPPACPENLTANAQNDETIALGWGASADAASYHVYRATEDGAFEQVATVDETSFTDQTTEADTTYRYEVTAANGAGEAEDCGTVEVTAIPFFGSPAIVAMAAIGSVGAVAAVRTRRG